MRCVGFSGMLLSFVTTLCSQKKIFDGWTNLSDRVLKSTFHIREYSIWATDHWKVLWNAGPKCLFCHPKSSFGEHKLCKMITKDSSNVMCWFSGMCWVFWDAMIFCINFARWSQKIVATWCVGFLGCVGFSGMLWSLVSTLQDDHKR